MFITVRHQKAPNLTQGNPETGRTFSKKIVEGSHMIYVYPDCFIHPL